MPKERKKLKDTKIGVWLKEKAPSILSAVGDVLPDKGGLGLIKNIIESKQDISEEDKKEALELIKVEMEQEKEISSRWNSDMSSDSWLSKNVRPIVLIYSWVLITLICTFSFFNILIPESYVTLIEALSVAVNIAYFGSRGIEKYQSIKIKKI
jgi:hypothetical protein